MNTHSGSWRIETPRLALRPFAEDDAEKMFANWVNDPDVTRYMTWPPHGTIEVTKKVLANFIADYEKPLAFHWIITYNGEPIGSLGVAEGLQSWEIGYCLGKPWWRQGLAPEAVAGVFHYLFNHRGFRRIWACHSNYNPGSGRVMQKNGMTHEGTLRQQMGLLDGRFTDMELYGILDTEWAAWEKEHPMEVTVIKPETAQ